MPNGQMIVRAVAPPAAPRVSSRNHAVTPRVRTRAGARAARSFLFPSPRSVPSEADAPSPSPAATPNRAPARGHGHQPRQRPADFQHQCVHGGGGLRPHHPGTSPRRLAVRRSARRLRPRPFDFVFPLTTPSDRAGPARLGQARARRQGRHHHFERRRDYHEGTRRDEVARGVGTAADEARNAPIGQQFPTGSRLASFVRAFRPAWSRVSQNDSFGFFAQNDAAFSSPPADRTRVPFP